MVVVAVAGVLTSVRIVDVVMVLVAAVTAGAAVVAPSCPRRGNSSRSLMSCRAAAADIMAAVVGVRVVPPKIVATVAPVEVARAVAWLATMS